MKHTVLLTFAVLVAAPVSLEAQLPQNAAQRIEAAKARASQANIPVELIEMKIAEGRAKGVSEDRIAAAVERRAAGLARAQEALGRSGRKLSAGEISAGADAMEQGVDATSLRAAIESAPEGRAAVALAVLGELSAQGIPVGRALEMVEQATTRGGEALANLPAQAAAARGGRGRPAGVGGPPAGRGGGRPAGVGGAPSGVPQGPPAGVPAGGTPGGKPAGMPGGKPGGTPGGRP